MARTEVDRAVLPSILDRLTDEDPRSPADPSITREESARRFRESVQRDLDWLLNSRRTGTESAAGSELAQSVYEYGLRDFSGLTSSVSDWRERLVADVRSTIARFEPRLTKVAVSLSSEEDPALNRVRFTITALLLMDPSPEQVVFDTLLDVSNGTYAVEDKT